MIHHIGIVVKDTKKAIDVFYLLGYALVAETVVDLIQHNYVTFLRQEDSVCQIELIQAIDSFSTIYNAADGLHHICWVCNNIESLKQEYKSNHLGKIFTEPIEAPALNNMKVVFGCLRNGMLVEYLILNS